MTTKKIIKNITPRNTQDIWQSSCEIISKSQDFGSIYPKKHNP
jgi:hypothetical protein